MVVVLANYLPPAVRGRMKLWFIEPRPNVFVSGIKDSIADSVVDYLLNSCPKTSGFMIFKKTTKAPGYIIYGAGDINRRLDNISGFPLIVEKSLN